MMRKTILIPIILFAVVTAAAQNRQDATLKREVTLYNPYKPSLPDVVKKSFLPDMTDTARVRHDFRYEVRTYPFMPPYVISPIKAAAMVPDPLPKLYNSFVNIGFGNYTTPLAEVSITSQRSKKANVGLYARHFSTNGKVQLQNLEKAFAGYMDNDASVFGRKFMRKSILDASVDFMQKTRYAYGYDTSFVNYEPDKKDIRLNYYNAGADLGYSSLNLDSSDFAYDFRVAYRFFFTGDNFNQHTFRLNGEMAKLWKSFYAGARAEFGYYKPSDSVSTDSKYVVSVNPFIKRSTSDWDVKLGAELVLDKGLDESARIHVYPDVEFSFSIVPAYLSFFTELKGRLEKNEPENVIAQNPFLLPGKTLFGLRNTDYSLIVNAGLKGETGIEGNYSISASYSIVNDMLFYANYLLHEGAVYHSVGNYFNPVTDQVEIFNVHTDMSGKINDKISFESVLNYYRYTLSASDYAWNRPGWDARLAVKYNLRDKIIAGAGANAAGSSRGVVTEWNMDIFTPPVYRNYEIPGRLSFNLQAEYRYTKILSFWLKFNNISFSRPYEWLYYPSQRFICLLGFTYSL